MTASDIGFERLRSARSETRESQRSTQAERCEGARRVARRGAADAMAALSADEATVLTLMKAPIRPRHEPSNPSPLTRLRLNEPERVSQVIVDTKMRRSEYLESPRCAGRYLMQNFARWMHQGDNRAFLDTPLGG